MVVPQRVWLVIHASYLGGDHNCLAGACSLRTLEKREERGEAIGDQDFAASWENNRAEDALHIYR